MRDFILSKKKELKLYTEVDDLNNSLFDLLKRWNISLENNVSKTMPKLFFYKADIQ